MKTLSREAADMSTDVKSRAGGGVNPPLANVLGKSQVHFTQPILPKIDGPRTLSRFGPVSMGNGSLTVLPDPCCILSSFLCSLCFTIGSSFANFLHFIEMGITLPLCGLSLKAECGSSLE
nr:hypothetical protein Itr_chr15CG02090 [Ipomoea trifida]